MTEGFRWDRLTVSVALSVCLLVPAISVGVVLAELIDEFSMGGVTAALHGSTFGIGLVVCGLAGAAVVARLGRRTTLTSAATLIVGGVTVFVVGPSWPFTLLGTGLAGFGAALVVVVAPGIINDHHGAARGRAYASVNAAPAVIGITLSLTIGAALSAGASWRPVYLAVTFVIALTLVVVARPVQPPATGTVATRVRLPDDRATRRGLVDVVIAVLAEFSIGIWAVTFLRDVGGASDGAAPLLSVVFPLDMFAGRLLLHRLVHRLGRHLTSVAFVVTGLGAAAMCLLTWLPGQVMALAVVGFFGGLLYPLAVDDLYHRANSPDSVTTGAQAAVAQGAAVIVGPLLLGGASDLFGLRWALMVVAVVAVAGAVRRWPRPTTTSSTTTSTTTTSTTTTSTTTTDRY